ALRNRRIAAKQVRRLRKELAAMTLEQRLRVPGLEPRRADLVVAGVTLVEEILRRLGAEELTLCDLSLREGLVLDYIAQHRKQIAQADRYPDVRRRSVFELAERCNFWPDHAHQGAPKRRHDEFGTLGRRMRRTVRTLAALLRLAESLDRSHTQVMSTIELHDRGDDDLLQIRTAGDAELELWTAMRHAAPFERLT